MVQVTTSKAKNPRYRNSKLSAAKFRKIVQAFAGDLSAADAAIATKVSKPTVERIFRAIRARLVEHPIVTFDLGTTPPPETTTVINRKTGGVAPGMLPIHEIALITRILTEQHFAGFEELDASKPENVERAMRLRGMKVNGRRRYTLWEKVAPTFDENNKAGEPVTRPFEPLNLKPGSTILVNEAKADPHDAHFQHIWKLLLKHPL